MNVTCKLALALAIFGGVAQAQLVQIGPDAASHCDIEAITSNLDVTKSTKIRGIIKDETGAPFEKLNLQLRGLNSRAIKTVTTETDGSFDLGSLKPGKYRLVALTHAFKQPLGLHCWNQAECVLDIALGAESTDSLYSQCPPK